MTRYTPRPAVPALDHSLDWLGKTPLQDLPAEVARHLQEVRTAGVQEGYHLGYEAGHKAGDELVKQLQSDQDAAVASRLREAEERGYRRGQQETAARLKEDFDKERGTWAEWKGQEERRRHERNLQEAEERGMAFERALRQREQSLEETLRKELEVEFQRKGQEARRKGFQEGAAEARRNSMSFEGTRGWALGVLHLPSDATVEQVRQRYRKLSMLLHPDQNPGLGDEFIKNLTRARDLMTD